jgi:pimeloyl-ACP methyl ester carboxylesterase
MKPLPVGPVAALSITTGFAAAAMLALGLFGGAQEHVITGVTLLAFALGWAMLACLSILRTAQPQRWAIAPAACLGLMGAGLLVAAPRGPALDALGWVWPPALLALAVSMASGARRQLHSRARQWCVYPVIGLYALSAVGGAWQTIQDSIDRRGYEGKGSLVSVDGRWIYLSCQGSGGPTVILESGLGETSTYWGWIAPRVARDTRVCFYDRAGRGRSDEAPSPQDGVGVATDLHAALAHVPGPFVLVGHSSGAQYVRIFAARYPTEVVGVVLLDPQPAEVFARLPIFPTFYRVFRRVSALLPPLARLGVARLISLADSEGLPQESRNLRRVYSSSPHSARSLRDEFAQLPTALRQAGAVRSLGDKPLIVVTAARDAEIGWLPLQDEMATLSRNSLHLVLPNATHSSLIENAHDSEASSEAILQVVASVRSGKTLEKARVVVSL